eukprot:TRINITY_DN12868_c0_g1_i1.p2 TRINITY_DN12868_c0_g1~~TRINITY_DN12868_c0_g1_i1.p2  ORF type:complete len:406 (-),score=105.37 TRINITY_DN12868_c0_g1_i1:52-1269(-)
MRQVCRLAEKMSQTCLIALFALLSVVQCISDTDRTQILNLHNSARKCAGLKPLIWETALETTAQNWANRCNFAHNSGRTTDYKNNRGSLSSVGENIAMGGPASSYGMERLFTLWWNEKKDYTCGTPVGQNYAVVGHYTQIMWDDTSALGCGVAVCSGSNFLTCNYATAGNYMGRLPYPTTNCPSASCTISATDGGTPPVVTSEAPQITTSTSKGTPTQTPPTLIPTTQKTEKTTSTVAPPTTKPVPTDAPYVPIEVLVTAVLSIGPSSVSVQTFAAEVTGVLGLPQDAISNIQVDLDRSTDQSTTVNFILKNTLKSDGTRVDPVAAAYQLREMAKNNDPLIQTTAMLQNMQVNGVEEQQTEEPKEDFVQSQAFVIIVACVGGAVLIAVAITITVVIVRKRRNTWM